MKRCIYTIILMMMAVQLAIAQSVRYEYWLDNDYKGRILDSSTGKDIILNIDIRMLNPGFHYLSFRTLDLQKNQWGGLAHYLFLLHGTATPASMACYEYWFDNDYEGRTVETNVNSLGALSIDVKHLKAGLHYFNFRTQDVAGSWGGITHYLFMVKEVVSTISIDHYEYWFDNDYEGRTIETNVNSIGSFPVDISHLHAGLHFFNFRTQDVSGSWGALAHYLFMIKNDIEDINILEYWIDDNQSESKTIDVTSNSIEITIDINGLEPEVKHTLNILGKNGSSVTSLVESYEFTISTSGAVNIVKNEDDKFVRVYSLDGTRQNHGKWDEVIKALPKGVYIVNGKKLIIK